MKQETDRRTEANLRDTHGHASPDLRGEPDSRRRQARNSALASPQTFTSQMLDYRSWWNLPGPKARKSHG